MKKTHTEDSLTLLEGGEDVEGKWKHFILLDMFGLHFWKT